MLQMGTKVNPSPSEGKKSAVCAGIRHIVIYVLTWLGFFMRVKFFSMQDEMDFPRNFLSPSEERAWKRSEDNPFLPALKKILPKRSLAM